ncbi:uncharacterized protein SAPINGB_P006055 [Magnusiomyces paraingens]|uniref:Uncharacterized protein n=1 Tax=Magnusiomyces paraingens TaxID=2606893 RepID=A0A5E8CA68_9ASCO|nr:uncharacterized protein SAPINGB_P006055 [Saprochaete ingens]VVT58136.1 unnamed protein product [Saprochaete ingens]
MSVIPHVPVNNFNAEQTQAALTSSYREIVSSASSFKNTVVFKPTSGGWTSSKPAVTPGSAASRILVDLSKSLKSLDTKPKKK